MLSEQIYQNLCQLIPGGVNSPVRSFKGMGIPPMVVDRGEKDCIFDVNGHQFIDLCCSWGALIHGHCHPAVVKASSEALSKGSTFGITTAIEAKLADKIISHLPSLEKIRFVSTGTEATMSAIRLARGFTNRDIIIKFTGNYHGHADFLLVRAGSGVIGSAPEATSAGIPAQLVQHTLCLPYNDIDCFRETMNRYEGRIAAVIVEPIAANMGVVPASIEFLATLRSETTKRGTLLVLDEVVTGFRIGLEGAQGLYGVKPDLTCLGKVVGGGFPAAAFGGRREIMDKLAPLGPVYQAGTLSGNPVAMAAGLKAIELVEEGGFYEELERKTKIITEPVSEYIKAQGHNACLQQRGSLFTLFFGLRHVNGMEDAENLDLEAFASYFRYMYSNGVYVSPSQYEACFISMAHQEDHLVRVRDLILSYLKS